MVISREEAAKINKLKNLLSVNFAILKLIFIGSNYKISRNHETAKGEIFCESILIFELIKVTQSKVFS